jgi:hypothetical protein
MTSRMLATAAPAINFNGLGQLLTPVDGVLKVIALLLMAIMAAIWVMELSGHTISRHGIVPNNLKWNAKTIAVIAVSAAIYVALRPIELQFVPGIGGFNPSLALGPVIGILFGLPGIIGAAFSFPIGDAISGALTVGSLAGFFGQSYYMYCAYKIVTSRHVPFTSWQAWVRLYVELCIGWVLIFVTISGWLDFTKLVPPLVAWGAVGLAIMINQLWVPAVLVPILVTALYPLVKTWGLFRGGLVEEGEEAVAGRISMQQAAAARAAGPNLTTQH